MTTRVLLAVAFVGLAAVAAGAAGAVVAAAVVTGFAGYALRGRYVAAPPPVLELPDPAPEQDVTVRRLERISAQLSIGMTDGRYFHRAVRPLLLRIAKSTAAANGSGPVAEGALFPGENEETRAPTLRELTAIVDRMEQL